MSQAIVEAFKSKIGTTGVGSFSEAMGARIYQSQAPGNSALPHCVWDVVGSETERYFGGVDVLTLRVSIRMYAGIDSGETLGDAEALLYTLLEEASLTVTGYDKAVVRFEDRNLRSDEEDAAVIEDSVTIDATKI